MSFLRILPKAHLYRHILWSVESLSHKAQGTWILLSFTLLSLPSLCFLKEAKQASLRKVFRSMGLTIQKVLSHGLIKHASNGGGTHYLVVDMLVSSGLKNFLWFTVFFQVVFRLLIPQVKTIKTDQVTAYVPVLHFCRSQDSCGHFCVQCCMIQ